MLLGAAALVACRPDTGFSSVTSESAPGPSSEAIGRQPARSGNGGAQLFSAGPRAGLCIAKQNSCAPPSSAVAPARRSRGISGFWSGPPAVLEIAMEGRDRRGQRSQTR